MKILTILAHPSQDSFCNAILKEYTRGASQNNRIKIMYLGNLEFDPILHEGYNKIQELEPDLKKAKNMIRWADKITIIFPIWWTSYPAILKGFFDRILLPGFGFKYTGYWKWKRLLKGKSLRIIATMDAPTLYYKCIIGDPAWKSIKGTLGFCGVSPIKRNYIGNLRFKTKKKRRRILQKFYEIGWREK